MTTCIIEPDQEFESLSAAIATAVADVTDRDPTTVGPLYRAVDPDALNTLFRSSTAEAERPQGEITFHFDDCTVTVHANDRIEVRNYDDQ